jgi:hypothetical protein
MRGATTRTYLRNITKHYLAEVTCPKCILSDNGTHFTSPMWKKQLVDLAIEVKFSPMISPKANPIERFMKEIKNF